MRRILALLLAIVLTTTEARAQARTPVLREIGRTAAGNPVLVEQRSIRRTAPMLDAVIRVRFAKAVRAPGGDWWSSRTRLTFDCSKRQVKVIENWYYGDTTWTRVQSHKVSGQPAFGTVMGGSMTSVGYDALCPGT